MKTDHFRMEIVSVKNILVHEEFDSSRSDALIEKFKNRGILTDPIIVASLGNGKYLQLDGMNRLNCFKKLGIKNILCQIVDYNNQEEVVLSSWIHLFKAKKKDFFDYLKKDKGLIIKKAQIDKMESRYIKEKDYGRLVTIVDKKEGTFLVYAGGDFIEKVKKFNYIVSFYKHNIGRSILPFTLTNRNIRIFFYEHPHLNFYETPDNNLMVAFPNLTPQQVIELVQAGSIVPAGITRHLIKGRCLNVDIPLSFFDNSKSLEKLNEELDEFLKKKIVRLYEEATIHFE